MTRGDPQLGGAVARYAEAKALPGQLDRYAYGRPAGPVDEAELDQARAAGGLLELDRTQVILDRGVYRELVKTAVATGVAGFMSNHVCLPRPERERAFTRGAGVTQPRLRACRTASEGP